MADRFGWIGPARQATALQALERELVAWTRAWALDAPAISVVSAEAEPCAGWYAEGAVVHCRSAEHLGHALVNSAEGAPDGLAAHIGDEAMRDLLRRITRESAAEPWAAGSTLRRGLAEPRLGALAATCDVRGVVLGMRVSRGVVDRLAPARLADASRLTERKTASLSARLPMVAKLDLGEMPLAELRGLRPGDVLITRSALDTRVQLLSSNGEERALATAQLGERDGRRALRILSP